MADWIGGQSVAFADGVLALLVAILVKAMHMHVLHEPGLAVDNLTTGKYCFRSFPVTRKEVESDILMRLVRSC